jgi:hypothetical protein
MGFTQHQNTKKPANEFAIRIVASLLPKPADEKGEMV